MNISKGELQAVIKTLPIGLYAKRGIAIAIGEKNDTSYYSPNTDEIVVSYPQICVALKKVPEDSLHKERIIRGILYHEVSHAFMTPKMSWNDIINVFEDERMETLLAKYYHNVDFKSNVYLFNGLEVGKVPAPNDSFSAFYNLVRFRYGKVEMLRKVVDLIQKYSALNKLDEKGVSYHYYYDVMDLYGEIEKDFKQNPQDYTPTEGQSSNSQDFDNDLKLDNGSTVMEGQGESCEGSLDPENIKKMFDSVVEDTNDSSLLATFQTILENFNKRNSRGSSINGYSGRINPRLANREDYKMFDRPFTQKSSNAFGTFHLNLFIDCSGSFWGSQKLVNQILTALSTVERKNPNFTLDVVFCGYGEKVCLSPKDRILHCCGDNDLDNDIYQIYRDLQKPNTYNYNIVLFDGDAFSSGTKAHRKNFKAFDFSNCTIISDRENERHINGIVKRAKVIYTKKYTTELLGNIYNVLSKAFR